MLAITAVRNFLLSAGGGVGRRLPGGASIAALHARYRADLPKILRDAKIQHDELTFADTTSVMYEWIRREGASHTL